MTTVLLWRPWQCWILWAQFWNELSVNKSAYMQKYSKVSGGSNKHEEILFWSLQLKAPTMFPHRNRFAWWEKSNQGTCCHKRNMKKKSKTHTAASTFVRQLSWLWGFIWSTKQHGSMLSSCLANARVWVPTAGDQISLHFYCCKGNPLHL